MVKSTNAKHPTKLGTLSSRISEKESVAIITDKFKNHPSKNEFRPIGTWFGPKCTCNVCMNI